MNAGPFKEQSRGGSCIAFNGVYLHVNRRPEAYRPKDILKLRAKASAPRA